MEGRDPNVKQSRMMRKCGGEHNAPKLIRFMVLNKQQPLLIPALVKERFFCGLNYKQDCTGLKDLI